MRLRNVLAAALLLTTPALGASLSDILAEIGGQLPSGSQITAAQLRGVLNDLATYASDGGDIDIRFARLTPMVCDNVADDGPALQTALNASVGHKLYLPANATCRVKSYISIPSHTYLIGASSVIQFDAAAAHSGSQDVTMMADGTSLAPVTDVVIDGVTFTGPGTSSVNDRVKIVANFAQHWVIRNSTFQNFGNTTNPTTRSTTYGHGIQFFNASDVVMENNTVTNNVGDGISFSNTPTRIRIRNNTVTNNYDSQIVPCTVGGDDIVTENNTMVAPAITNPPVVLDKCVHTLTIGNKITAPSSTWCILLERVTDDTNINQDNKIIGNTCDGSRIQVSGAGTTQGTQSVPKGGLTKVIGNTVINSNGQGIYIADSSGTIVTGNHVINATGDGISEESFSVAVGNNTITDNIIDGANVCLRQINSGGSVLDSNFSGNFVKNCVSQPYQFLANSGSDGPSSTFTPTLGGSIGTATYAVNTSRWKRLNDKFYWVAYTFNITALGTAASGTYTFSLPNSTTSAGSASTAGTACSFWNRTTASTANLAAGYINAGDSIAKLVISTIAANTYELTCVYEAT